jgi:hypothetical protein
MCSEYAFTMFLAAIEIHCQLISYSTHFNCQLPRLGDTKRLEIRRPVAAVTVTASVFLFHTAFTTIAVTDVISASVAAKATTN